MSSELTRSLGGMGLKAMLALQCSTGCWLLSGSYDRVTLPSHLLTHSLTTSLHTPVPCNQYQWTHTHSLTRSLWKHLFTINLKYFCQQIVNKSIRSQRHNIFKKSKKTKRQMSNKTKRQKDVLLQYRQKNDRFFGFLLK